MSSLPKTYYTPEQYLALEREAEYRSEYNNGQIYPMNGQPYAMAGASEGHILIIVNVSREVSLQFKGRPCKVYVTNMRVKVSPTGMHTYPDIVAVCNKPHFEDERADTLLNPTVIIEVLSPSTGAYDRGDNFAHYRKLASLTDYVLVSQTMARVEHYARRSKDSDQWVLTEISGLDGVLRMVSIGCEVALKDIYDKVNLAEGGDGRPEPQV